MFARLVYGAMAVFSAGILLTAVVHADTSRSESETAIAEVTVVNYEDENCHPTSIVYAETEDGNLWSLYADGFEKGDIVLLTVDNKGTAEIEDDEILDIRKYIY